MKVRGKPLIAYTIEEAKKCSFIDRMILSSEDDEIIQTAKNWGCEAPFVRPNKFAQDDTPMMDTIFHAIESLPEKYDYVLLLQPTSPLRKSDDIKNAIQLCIDYNAPACVSVAVADKSPYWMVKINGLGRLKPLINHNFSSEYRRQDLPIIYQVNGAIYFGKTTWLLETKTFFTEQTLAYIMNKERSLDIDTEFDLKILNILI